MRYGDEERRDIAARRRDSPRRRRSGSEAALSSSGRAQRRVARRKMNEETNEMGYGFAGGGRKAIYTDRSDVTADQIGGLPAIVSSDSMVWMWRFVSEALRPKKTRAQRPKACSLAESKTSIKLEAKRFRTQ